MAALTKVYDAWGCQYNATFIPQVSNWTLNTNIDELVLSGSGEIDPTFVAESEEKPELNFTTSAIAIALGAAGIGGSPIAAGTLFTTYLQKAAKGGTRTAGATHLKVLCTEGILVPRRISAQNNQAATIEMTAAATFDLTNQPFIVTDTQALVGTSTATEAFTVGEVDINGTTIQGIQSIEIDFGINLWVLSSDGNHQPTFAAIQNRRPSITFTTNDASQMVAATFGLSGVAQGATDSIVYLRAFSEGATRKTDVTSEHISFTIDEGMIRINDTSASADPAVTSFTITPSSDAVAAIIVIDTTAAIA